MDARIENLLREAGAILAGQFGRGVASAEKDRFDLVTSADRDIEALLAERLHVLFPSDGFLGEESGEVSGASGARWLADPLDGTTDFVMGKPYFSVSLAREEDGRITEGYVFNPVSNELYHSTRAEGVSCLNGKRIRVSETCELRRALVVFGFSARMDRIRRYYEDWGWIFDGCRKGVGWTTPALTLCNVARGRVDAFFDFGASPVGHAAASLILGNAGGVVRNYDLTEYDHRTTGVIGCTPGLLACLARGEKGST